MRPKQQRLNRARMPYKRSSRISRHFWSPDLTRISDQKEFFNSHRRFRSLRGLSVIGDSTRSQAPVEPSERVGKHQRHDEDARPEDERVLGLAQIKAAHTTDKQVADG